MKRNQRVERLVVAAHDLLSEKPYRDITLDEVAQRAGVTRSLIFYHFESREGLFTAALERHFELTRSRFAPLREKPSDAQERRMWLRREVETFIAMASNQHRILTALTVDLIGVPEIRSLLEDMEEFTSGRLAWALGVEQSSDLLHGALRAWCRHCIDLSLHGVPSPHVTNRQLCDLMLAHLASSLYVIAHEEPHLGIDPSAMSLEGAVLP